MSDASVPVIDPISQVSLRQTAEYQSRSPIAPGVSSSVSNMPETSRPSYNALTQSLFKFKPSHSAEASDILLKEVSLASKEEIGKAQTLALNAIQEKKRQNWIEVREKIEEAQVELEKAKKASKKKGFLSNISAVLTGIAGVLTMAVGAAMVLSGAGIGLGGVLLALGAMSFFSSADQIVQHQKGVGIFGRMVESMGGSEEQASRWDVGVNISLALVVAIGSVLAFRYDSAWGSAHTMSQSLSQARHASEGISTAASIGAAATEVSAASIGYVAAKHIDEEGKRAVAAELQAQNEQFNDYSDQILARISALNTQFNAMLDDVMASIRDRGETLARAKFTG